MAAATVGVGTLRELSRLATDGHPVLSLYVDLDASSFPTPAARHAELSALLSHAGAHDADAERVRELLRTRPELVRGAHGLAIFSSADAGVLEAVALPGHVESMAVVDTVPWLEPLAAMLTSENWGVAVVSRRGARLFRGGPRSLVEFATIDDEVHRRHAQGGWSQANFQRGIEQQVAEHVRHTTDGMLRAHRRRPFDHLVVVASDELWPEVGSSLHADLQARLAGHVAHDLEHATAEEIAQAVAPVVQSAARDRERALVARLEDALGTGGPAAAGLDEVLATLEQERVATLLVAEGASLTAGLCSRCGRLAASGENHCPLDGAPLGAVDAVEHAIEIAAHQGIDVVVVHHELAALREHGSIAALLRW
jgi:peptide chain release factor subunit 1